MSNLLDKNQIKDLILNDINNKIFNNISNGNDTTITIPIYVYDMFKDEFEDKGYTIIKKETENNNYKISIPLLNCSKKEITIEIFEKIVNNKQFYKLLNYTKFDLHDNFFFKDLLKNCKDEKILKYVIDNVIELECENDKKWRPIHYICVYSTPEMIKYIIDKGVDLECEDIYKYRPIHCICRYSTLEMLKYIIDKGVDLECEDIDKYRPIHFICRYSIPETIKYIIDKGVNLECETYYKKRPIHYICQYSTPEMIKYIIDKGVNLECEDRWGNRPIHYICWKSTSEMIKYIIDKGIKTKFDNDNLNLEIKIKDNNKLSSYEKDEIIEYVTFKILSEKYKNT
jgi:ankyrin repeat protein